MTDGLLGAVLLAYARRAMLSCWLRMTVRRPELLFDGCAESGSDAWVTCRSTCLGHERQLSDPMGATFRP